MKHSKIHHVFPFGRGFVRMNTLVLTAVCTLGLLPQFHATQPMVAIHDSELTRALESLPASGLPLPPAPGPPAISGGRRSGTTL